MDLVNLLITLASGAVGGNVAGAALPADKNLGALGNTIAGLIGGSAGTYIAQILGILAQAGLTNAVAGADASSGLNIGHLLGTVASSGVGGALLTAVVGFIKSQAQKS